MSSSQGSEGRFTAAAFAFSVFLGAFLVFQIQPITGKWILPWFGGAPAVWITCVLFFQAMLFLGYLYTHLAVRRLSPRRQGFVYGLLLVASLCLMPVLPAETWKPDAEANATLHILIMLSATLGLPYLAVAAASPLLQAWYARRFPSRSPYVLYALSCFGSLLALLTYPFLIEPLVKLRHQAGIWSWTFAGFGLACGYCAWRSAVAAPHELKKPREEDLDAPPSGWTQWTLWVAFAAVGSVLFLATTNQLCLNVASVPFLWILPLSVYLVTYILAFSDGRFYPRRLFTKLAPIALLAFYVVLPGQVEWSDRVLYAFSFTEQAVILGLALFVCCMVCHGELYVLKPAPRRLTGFYLAVALGGALGGILVGVAAPLFFLLYQELHLGMVLLCVLLLVNFFREKRDRIRRGPLQWAWRLRVAGTVGLVLLLAVQTTGLLKDNIVTRRSFHGVVRVIHSARDDDGLPYLKLYHGTIIQGAQCQQPGMMEMPSAYYSPCTGVGAALGAFEGDEGRRIGILGLGVATLAAYGRGKDHITFYEINPDVVEAAKTHFSYLRGCKARWDIRQGDGRMILEQEASQGYHVLVMDAFSSDAVPVHLLTREAFQVYDRHLARSGIMALNATNKYADISPVVYRLADELGYFVCLVTNRGNQSLMNAEARWILLSKDRERLDNIIRHALSMRRFDDIEVHTPDPSEYAGLRCWTDDYSNLFQLIL